MLKQCQTVANTSKGCTSVARGQSSTASGLRPSESVNSCIPDSNGLQRLNKAAKGGRIVCRYSGRSTFLSSLTECQTYTCQVITSLIDLCYIILLVLLIGYIQLQISHEGDMMDLFKHKGDLQKSFTVSQPSSSGITGIHLLQRKKRKS